ncbi:IS5 family transposase [Amycolatopsis sp. NPDC051903]|uniref:IS5 family transposase n=1 Tax=Amycolatopsis sp. NPDC051903 TaxID=3363936 RepID=UPI0037B37E04
MARRHELTDGQWQAIAPLLPVPGAKTRPRVDDRRVRNGMLFKAKTGVAWRARPQRYGPWKPVVNRFWRWSRTGTLAMLVTRVRVVADPIDELDREVSVDCSIVRAHQHAAGARPLRTGRPGRAASQMIMPPAHGGPTTKIRLACDGHGGPLSAVVTGDNINDCTMVTHVMSGIEFRRPGPGRPPTRPGRVPADKRCSSRAIRSHLRRQHAPATIHERRDPQANRLHRGPAGGRPPVFDRVACKRRNIVGRCSNRLLQFRAMAIAFDKIHLLPRQARPATLLIWL